MVTKDKESYTFKVLTLSNVYNGYNMSKYGSNLQIPYYNPLNQWLLGATNGNQGQMVMHIAKVWDYQATYTWV